MVTINENMELDAVIFDFDGVIVDTEPLHYRAFQKALTPFGLAFSWNEYVEIFIGFDDRDAFIEAFKRKSLPLPDDILKKLIQTKATSFIDCIKDGVTAYPGVLKLIQNIHKSGTPLAIASGALRSDINPILDLLQIADCFDLIVTAEDVTHSKPDPESYILAHNKLQTMHNLSIPKGRCIVFEDTPAGISAAKDAGLTVVAITNSYPASYLDAADIIVDSLEHILKA